MTKIARNRANALWLMAIWLASAVAIVQPAAAQESDSDLRKLNQQLTAQVQELQKELQQSKDQVKQLQGRIAQLEQQLAAARKAPAASANTIPPLEPEQISIDETVANASPRALLHALTASYDQAMAGEEPGKIGTPKRRAYIKKVDNWRAGAVREYRSAITWHVRALDAKLNQDGQEVATLVAVDPQTDVRLGNPFDVVLPAAIADRLARLESRGELGVLVLRGILVPDIRLNEDRESRGSFDVPPFIGTFAELNFRIDLTSLQPAKPDAAPKG